MRTEISEKVKFLNNMLCEIDNLYQMLLLKKGLSDSEYVVMFAILELGEGCLQKDIADNSLINKKTINSTIKKLERKQLIKLKAGKYPNLHIYLTNEGKKYIQENIIPIINLENTLLEKIPDNEFNILMSMFEKYVKVFRGDVENLN